MIYGGCVCVGTADNKGLDMLRVFIHSGGVNGSSVDGGVMQSKWKKVEAGRRATAF